MVSTPVNITKLIRNAIVQTLSTIETSQDDEYRTRSDELLTQNANNILKLLVVYMENSGKKPFHKENLAHYIFSSSTRPFR